MPGFESIPGLSSAWFGFVGAILILSMALNTLFSRRMSREQGRKILPEDDQQLLIEDMAARNLALSHDNERLKARVSELETRISRLMSMEDFFILGLDPDSLLTESCLRDAYRRAVKRTHPDRGGSMEAFLQVQRAHERLSASIRSGLSEKFS